MQYFTASAFSLMTHCQRQDKKRGRYCGGRSSLCLLCARHCRRACNSCFISWYKAQQTVAKTSDSVYLCVCVHMWRNALQCCHNYLFWMQQPRHLFKKSILSVFDLWLSARCHSEGNYKLWMDIICTHCLCKHDILPSAGTQAMLLKEHHQLCFWVLVRESISYCVCACVEVN